MLGKLRPCQGKQDDTKFGMHGGVGGAVSRDDSALAEWDGETGGDDGVGWMGQVICIYPYAPFTSVLSEETKIASALTSIAASTTSF